MIRKLTRKDIVEYYGHPWPMTLKGVVSENENGEIMGVAAYYVQEKWAVMVSDIKPEISKKEVIRGTRAVLKMTKDLHIPILAAKGDFDNDLLKHFGFESLEGTDEIVQLKK